MVDQIKNYKMIYRCNIISIISMGFKLANVFPWVRHTINIQTYNNRINYPLGTQPFCV